MNGPASPVFRFCPGCASERMAAIGNGGMRCGACGFTFFQNVAGAVAVLIHDGQGRLLLTRRASAPAEGMWDLPGGFIDPDETAEAAVSREIREELNLPVTETTYLGSMPGTYVYAGFTYDVINLVYSCRVAHFGGMKAGDDASEIRFFYRDDIDPAQIGLASIRKILKTLERKE